MKKKMLLIASIGIFISIFIYYITINNKLKLVALGDGLSSGMTAYNVNGYSYNDYLKDDFKQDNNLQSYYNFSEANLTVSKLIEKINKNETLNVNGKKITIQQAIKNANIITIGIGIDELAAISLNNKVTQKDIKIYLNNIEHLLKLIKKLNHDKVILLGLYQAYNIDEVDNINKKLKLLTQKYNYEFVDISKVINNSTYFFDNTSYYLNYKGHDKISEELLKII